MAPFRFSRQQSPKSEASKVPELLYPLYYTNPIISAHKKARRYEPRRYSLAITSRPEKIARAHTRKVLKALEDCYY